jgi:hypothetical protein
MFLRDQGFELGCRIEVKDKKGEYSPVDCPLRAGYLTANKEAQISLSA